MFCWILLSQFVEPSVIIFFCLLQLTAQKRVIQRPRLLRLPRLWNQGRLLRRRRRRCGPQSHSTGQRPWRRTETPSIPALVLHRGTSWTTTKFSSIPWLPSQLWRRSRTIIPWFSLLTSVLIRGRSRMPSRKCTKFRPRKSTLWSGKFH